MGTSGQVKSRQGLKHAIHLGSSKHRLMGAVRGGGHSMGGGVKQYDPGKSCGHFYREVCQNPLTSPASSSPLTWAMFASLTSCKLCA